MEKSPNDDILPKKKSSKKNNELKTEKTIINNFSENTTIEFSELKNELKKINKTISDLNKKYEEFHNDLKGFIEIQRSLVNDKLGIKVEPIKEKIKYIKIVKKDEYVELLGNTYNHRKAIKSYGGSWDNDTKSWNINIDQLESFIGYLEEKELVKGIDYVIE